MLNIEAKDIVLLFAGAVIALPITAGWQATRAWLTRRGQEASDYENSWQRRLKSTDLSEQQKAVHELLTHCLYQFVLGNVMFAVSGLAWVADPIASSFGGGGFYRVQGVFAAATSFFALVYFSSSLRWLRRFLRALR